MSPPFTGPVSRPPWLIEGTRRIGRYQVGPSLGKGGMGEVFEAWDTMLGRRVALKLLTSWSATAALRLLQEAKHQARVDHPNVCRVLDFDFEGDLPFIAMQLVAGPTLKDAGLDPAETAEVIQRVAEAVHAAHRLGLIHRDLKPNNILLERTELGGWVPYVCDFGLAKDLTAESLTTSLTSQGTPAFMAPEQLFQNGASVGTATDIYGLGATLYDALTGQPPLPSGDDQPRAGRATFPLPRALNTSIPKPLERIILRCLEWHPDDRYPSAAALGEDLRRFLDHEALQPRSWSLAGRIKWSLRRHPVAFVGLVMAFLAGLALVGAFTWSRQESARQALVARRFTGAIKDIQYQMRIERMLPAHDLRPGFGRVRTRMEEIRSSMQEIGPPAQGPGEFALGWGHLLLREPLDALRAFNAAWEQGYRTPEVATAWARAHCDAYADTVSAARQQGPHAVDELKKTHLEPARALLAGATPDRDESHHLVQAQLESYDRNPEEALLLARKVASTQPSSYEARTWESAALASLGFMQQLSGHYEEAEKRYREADFASHQAQAMGRSDEMALKVELNRRLAWIAVKGDAGGTSPNDFNDIEILADRLLYLNPEWLPAVADKLTVIWRRGDYELNRGMNPAVGLQRGLALLDTTKNLPAASVLLQRDRAHLYSTLSEWEYLGGRDPRTTILKGLEGVTPDENTAWLLVLRARWFQDHGLDPRPDLASALDGVAHPTFQDPHEYGMAIRRAMIGRWATSWAFFNRQDPRQSIDQALEACRLGLTVNARSSDLLMESARCLEWGYRVGAAAGTPNPSLLDQATDHAHRALAIQTSAESARCLTSVLLRQAEHAIRTKRKAETYLKRAAGSLEKARSLNSNHPELTLLDARHTRLRLSLANAEQSLSLKSHLHHLIKKGKGLGVLMDEFRAIEGVPHPVRLLTE